MSNVIVPMWDDNPIDVSGEVNFIWSIANKLRGLYQSGKYKDVIIPMSILRRFECALAPTQKTVVEQFEKNPNYPDLVEFCNDSDYLVENLNNYIEGFSSNGQGIIRNLQIKEIFLKSKKLQQSPLVNSEDEFRFSYFDDIDNALLQGLEQNQNFFSMFLSNPEIKNKS